MLLDAPVVANVPVAQDYLRITLAAPEVAAATHPGQFLMMTIARADEPAPVLPRPMAIYGVDVAAGTVDVVYRTVGSGTQRMATWAAGERMTIVGPLGRGFTIPSPARSILLLGRGIGNCSLTTLVPEAVSRGLRVTVVVSARNPEALVGGDTCREQGATEVHEVVDSDGTSDPAAVLQRLGTGAAGYDGYYVCGSRRLLEMAATLAGEAGRGGPSGRAEVQVSLEAHMACGLGYCHGCAAGRPGLPAETPLVCRDGPVFRCAPGEGEPASSGARTVKPEGDGAR
jgi:dihydroorotate dehydrogenase electron transfer subunit